MTNRSVSKLGLWFSAAVLGSILLLALGADARAACDEDGLDAEAIADARGAIASACPCDGAVSRAAYLDCATDVVDDRIAQAQLIAACRPKVLRCVRQSTCGRPGAVTCFRTVNGKTQCSIERSAAKCTAPQDGSVCGGDLVDSCCDSCTAAACEPSPVPSPTPLPTPTPTLGPDACNPQANPTCTPPPCPGYTPPAQCSGCSYACPKQCCPNGCGVVCVTPAPTPPPTPGPCDPVGKPTCTPPPCLFPGGPGLCPGCSYACPSQCCPNGCGTVCVTPTPAPH